MLSDRVSQFLSINVTGRVFMLCTGEGVKNTAQIRRYEKEVRNRLQEKALKGAELEELQQLLPQELERLRRIIQGEDVDDISELSAEPKQTAKHAATSDNKKSDKTRTDNSKTSTASFRPEAAPLQQKLAQERKPLSELLLKDCVHHQLLDFERAKYWVHNLSGRMIDQAESEIVSELAQNLHQNVKNFIRKNRNESPWPTPALQEQLRRDIMSVKTVKGMLEMSSQLAREIRKSEETPERQGVLKKLINKLF